MTNAAGTPLSGISVNVYDSNNANIPNTGSIAGISTSGSGSYTIAGLAPGTYFVKTFATGGFLDEVYNDIACLNCSAYGGTPIDLTSANRTDINFSLAAGGRISGRITDPTGAPLASSQSGFVSAQIYSATGFSWLYQHVVERDRLFQLSRDVGHADYGYRWRDHVRDRSGP